MYLWSIDGIQVKESPSVRAKILGYLKAGNTVIIKGKTNTATKSNLLGGENHGSFDSLSQITLKGNWAQIEYKGKIGYVSDIFLLPLPTFDKKMAAEFLTQIPGVKKTPNGHKGSWKNILKFSYQCRDTACQTKIELKNWTVEEGLVFWFFLTRHYNQIRVRQQTDKKIQIDDNKEHCEIEEGQKTLKIEANWTE